MRLILPGALATSSGSSPNPVLYAWTAFSSISRKRWSSTVPVWMGPHPVPGGGDHVFELRLLGLPAELGPDPLARGNEYGGVAGAPRRLDGLYRTPRHRAGGLHHLADGEAGAVAEVVYAVLPRPRPLQRQQVGAPEVLDVDVVAHRRPVTRRVVGAEELDRVAPLARGPENQRNEVGLGAVILPEPPARPRNVEVAQQVAPDVAGPAGNQELQEEAPSTAFPSASAVCSGRASTM